MPPTFILSQDQTLQFGIYINLTTTQGQLQEMSQFQSLNTNRAEARLAVQSCVDKTHDQVRRLDHELIEVTNPIVKEQSCLSPHMTFGEASHCSAGIWFD